MQQLELFEPTTMELMNLIGALKSEISVLRKGIFQRYGELKKDQEFLETQLEIVVRTQIEREGK